MIKVTVMYPDTPGARFDHAYYRDRHMPLIQSLMGANLKSWSVDKGVSGGRPGTPPTYVAMCHLVCESVETFQAGFGPHVKDIVADTKNYTDIAPVMQVSEIVVG